jgi:hypothetical protein
MVSDEVLLKKLKDSLSSDKSYENYVTRLNRLKDVTRSEKLEDLLLSPETMHPKIKDKYPNVNTRKNMLVPVLSLFRLNNQLDANAQMTWKQYFEEVTSLVNVEAKKNTIKEKQKEKYVSTEEIEEKRQEMKNGNPHVNIRTSQQYVLLTLYCDITPKRSDLGQLRVYIREDPCIKTENYLVLRSPRSGLESYLVMNVYKTAKSYGRLEEILAKETVLVLIDSLKRFPRNYVFVGRSGRPFTSNDAYGDFVERTFLELFGRAMGTSLWRHVYVSEKVDPNQSEEALERIARKMCHSANVQRYERFSKIAKEHMKTLKKV